MYPAVAVFGQNKTKHQDLLSFLIAIIKTVPIIFNNDDNANNIDNDVVVVGEEKHKWCRVIVWYYHKPMYISSVYVITTHMHVETGYYHDYLFRIENSHFSFGIVLKVTISHHLKLSNGS